MKTEVYRLWYKISFYRLERKHWPHHTLPQHSPPDFTRDTQLTSHHATNTLPKMYANLGHIAPHMTTSHPAQHPTVRCHTTTLHHMLSQHSATRYTARYHATTLHHTISQHSATPHPARYHAITLHPRYHNILQPVTMHDITLQHCITRYHNILQPVTLHDITPQHCITR